jgi:hypothetical protein
MRQVEHFNELSQAMKEKKAFRYLKSKQKLLLIDLEDTLISKVEVKNLETLSILRDQPEFEANFICFETAEESNCCDHEKSRCFCHIQLWKIRPGVSDFLSAVSKNFEIMPFSRISSTIMKSIVQEIENFLTKEHKSNSSVSD